MAAISVTLTPSYAQPQRATWFKLSVGDGKTSYSIDLTFEEGLTLLREVTAAAKKYRDAIQADLEVTARLAAAEPPAPLAEVEGE